MHARYGAMSPRSREAAKAARLRSLAPQASFVSAGQPMKCVAPKLA
jgi:hypothetical protein